MTNNFDWEQYKPVEQGTTQPSVETSSFDWGSYKQMEEPKLTLAQKPIVTDIVEGVKGLGRLGARAGVSALAAPSKGIGGLLNFLASIGTQGEPGQIKGMGTRLINRLGNWFNKIGEEGQAQLKGDIEKVLGESYGTAEEALTQFAERAADIYARLPVSGMAIPSLFGGATGQIVKELGFSPEVQQITEFGGIMTPDIIKGIRALAIIPKTAKSGLQLPKLVEKVGEKLKGIKAKVWGGRKEKIYKNVANQAEELIGKIKRERLPLSREIEEGIDVGARTEQNFRNIENISKQLPEQIDQGLIANYLENVKKKIEFGGVPSVEQKQILKLADEYLDKWKGVEGGFKGVKPSQLVQQFRNINKDLKNLYETKFVHGERLDTMKFYEGLKNEIEKTIELGSPKEFSNLFKEVNKDFSQLKRLERFNKIMEEVAPNGTIDAKKLNSYIKSPRKTNILRKQIGQEGFDKLRLISDDLSKVQDKLKLISELDTPEIIKSAVTYGLMSFLKIPFAKAAQVGTKALQIGRGYLLTSPQGARDVSNFLKAIRAGSKKAAVRYLTTLDKNATKWEESTYPK